jgi:NADPH:quinone reductase-like Zn-dependent oxidoreductase
VRAIVATPEGSTWTERREVPPPEPAGDEALVAVRAFSVNRGELALVRMRGGGWRPGQDIAGEVVRPAADGSGPPAGTLVAGLVDWEGWAEQAPVPTHRLATVPEGVDLVRAAALPMAGTTAAGLVRRGGPLLGARVLVSGASGGVGHLAAQLAAIGGASVTAVAPRRAETLRGLDGVTVAAAVSDADGPFDLVLEAVGGETLRQAIERVARDGTVVAYGNSSREPTQIDFLAFGHDEATLRTYFSARHEHEAGRRLRLLLDLLAAGRLHVEVGLRASWDRLDEALDALQARAFAGKAVLLVD